MKKIKIKINAMNMWKETDLNILQNRFLSELNDEFDFEWSDNPDFIFASCKGSDFSYLHHDCIRILYTNENTHPDFEFFDYCIGYNKNLSFGDRYLYYLPAGYYLKKYLMPGLVFPHITKDKAYKILREKDLFCDFTYNHDNERKIRKHYLDLLNTYKPVTNSGILYNDHLHIQKKIIEPKYDFDRKIEIQKRCKFSIIVESCSFSAGLITEKIFHAILSNTIPIYYGEKEINELVNPKRYINAKEYTDDELISLIKKIDCDDDLFASIISEPCLLDELFFANQQQELTNFLRTIFLQNPVKAQRRPANEFSTLFITQRIINSDKLYNSGFWKCLYLKFRQKSRLLKKIKRLLFRHSKDS